MPILPTKMGMPFGSANVSGEKIVEELKKLTGTNKLPGTAVQNVVMSVNGKTGNVDVTLDTLDAQKKSTMLTEISSTTWGNSVLVGTDLTGHMLPINYTEYSKQILSLNNKDELIKNLGLKPGEYPVTSVNGEMGAIVITAEDVGAAKTEHTHLIYEITGLLDELDSKLSVGESIPYADLTGAPAIPDPQVNSDWLANSGKSEILNKPTLFDGNYNSLSNRPELFSGKYSELSGKPNLSTVAQSGSYNDLTNLPALFDGKYTSLMGAPILSKVATSGSFNDLADKPAIPATQVNADWNAISGVSQILNKPVLFDGNYNSLTNKPSLFSGSYSDLTNKPTIPAAQVNPDWNATTGLAQILNKPSIPGVQIQSDWNQSNTSALDFIKNKPTIPSVAYPVNSVNGKTGIVSLTNTDVGAAPTVHTHTISDVTGLQIALDSKITTGSSIPYSSLTGTPTIPAAQIQANWTQTTTTALDYIKNKPNLFSGSYTDLTNKPTLFDGTWSSLTGKPALSTVATSGSYVDLTNKPTIPVIPTNVSSFTNDSGYLTTVPVTSVNTKTGAVVLSASDVGAAPVNQGTKYYRQAGTQATGVKVKYYQVTSDANGAWTLALGTDFTEVFDVQAQAVSSTGIAGVRQSTVNAFTSTSTTITGMTWGNSVLVTILLSGTNSLTLTPNTVVRIRVEGIAT